MNEDKLKKIKKVLGGEINKIDQLDKSRTIEFKKSFGKLVDNLFEANESKRSIEVNFPNEVKVSNFPKQKEIEIPEYPEEIKINNFDELADKMPKIKEVGVIEPKWYKGFSLRALEGKLEGLLSALIVKISNLVYRVDLSKHRDPDKAISVMLVDKNGRYVNPGGKGGVAIAPAGGSGGGEASEFDVVNVSLPTANTEVEYTLPKKTRQFFVKLRSQSVKLEIRKASGGDYFTVAQNGWLSPANLRLIDQTLILKTSSASQVAEIMIYK
jgi:hypothetical protein